MQRIPVTSSQISSYGFDPGSNTLEIEFPNKGKANSVYQYADVPPEVWEAFKNAPSKGSYFIRNIKNGGYKYTKISG